MGKPLNQVHVTNSIISLAGPCLRKKSRWQHTATGTLA